jgi:hypothetical protein
LSSAPCSQTATFSVLPLIWEIKFHTHTNPHVKWYFCMF